MLGEKFSDADMLKNIVKQAVYLYNEEDHIKR